MGEFSEAAWAKKMPIPTESQEMQMLAGYLDAKGYLWCHPANEGRRSPRAGARLKREGLKRGVPDVLIFAPVQIAIELKRVKGGVATPEQTEWLARLSESGWKSFLAHGADSAIRFIDQQVESSKGPNKSGELLVAFSEGRFIMDSRIPYNKIYLIDPSDARMSGALKGSSK